MLQAQNPTCHINLQPITKQTSAQQIRERAVKYEREIDLKPEDNDEVWIIIDADKNQKKDLEALFNWEKKAKHRGLAFSNPKFEYWLLMHFDKGNNLKTPKSCDERLRKFLPNYSKNNLNTKILEDKAQKAISNANSRNKNAKNPISDYHTTMSELVKNILATKP